jgi:trehalose/maltose hydrolase-like predicted phosphorylase
MIGNSGLGWELYQGALTSDYNDIQGGTTAEGIHAGVMAGTVWIALSVYAGLNLRKDEVHFNPELPENWETLSFNFLFKGVRYYCMVAKNNITITAGANEDTKVQVWVKGTAYALQPGTPLEILF